jgi:signal transduction histidine kinase/DNA-binding NarL/FixJ family response regulator
LRHIKVGENEIAYKKQSFMQEHHLMPQATLGPKSQRASETASALAASFRRKIIWSLALVLSVALATAIVSASLVADQITRSAGEDLQVRATALARTIDLRLRTYTSALDTIAESASLRDDFDLSVVELEARRVGALFGGWFVLGRGGDVMDILMSTARADGRLPPAEPRSNYPELVRAEQESMRTGRPVVSDAFQGRVVGELIITTVKPVKAKGSFEGFLYFSVTLRDITAWLEETMLNEGEFAAIADGTRRVIARSKDNEDFLFIGLPDWYIAFTDGRDSGIAAGPPAYDKLERLFAMQRLEVAPGWTLAISRPLPSRLSALHLSMWPLTSMILALLVGGTISGLFLSREKARFQAAERAATLKAMRLADARKSRLMAVLAHDLRIPLVAMLGALDLFREGTGKLEQERVLHRLKADGHGMLTLIDDVLELARLGAGEARLRPEPFAPIALINQVGDLVRPAAARHGTAVLVQVDEFPMMIGDVASLRRVLLNFATNAVKATRGGSIRLSAKRGAADNNSYSVTFEVTDTGCGIAPEDIPRLFLDFGMLERDVPAASGTGLGLAICRRLAAAMNGEVGVDSVLGQGSRFWLRVPLSEAEKAVSAADLEHNAPFRPLAGLKVLVAEDHDIIRQVTCANLARAGMFPTEAADGVIAVELAEAEAFDLILLDLRMPRLDGDAAAVRIRGGSGPSARARIICVTAHQSPEIALMLSDLAFDGCIRKPLQLEQLTDVMQMTFPSFTADVSVEQFDAERLTQLREIDGGALLTRTLKAFAADIEAIQAKLPALIAERNTIGAGRLVHRLVGIADILGARTFSAELRKLEDLIHDEDFEGLKQSLVGVDNVMSQTHLHIQNMLSSESLPPS